MHQSVCLNPACSARNDFDHQFCCRCGQPLILTNRYRALEELGQGSFGKTFKAIDLHLPSQPFCVIKQFLPKTNDPAIIQKATEMFLEEAKRLDELGKHHDQIPELMAHFAVGDQQYLIQEFIDGQNLAEALSTETFSPKTVKQVLFDMLRVLHFIHSKNFIHRDVKPENIIRRHVDHKLFLVDFGTVKYLPTNQQTFVSATVVGTEAYMAPEQARGQPKYASDLYSLGVTCLVLLTGVSPLELFDVAENKWAWRQFIPASEIDEPLGKILDKLTESAVKYRYQTVAEVVRDIKQSMVHKAPRQHQKTSVKKANSPNAFSHQITKPNLQNALTTQKAIAKTPSLLPTALSAPFPSRWTEHLGGGIQLQMVLISAGQFLMGSLDPNNKLPQSEQPRHRVKIEQPFYLGQYVITQAQWKVMMGNNPAWFSKMLFGKRTYPVEKVSWNDCQKFLKRLCLLTKKRYRLPSEAEWEYACRAGSEDAYYFDYQRFLLEDYAWFLDNSRIEIQPIGRKKINPWGLFDMHGNVWEWCEDDWEEHYQMGRTQTPFRCSGQAKVIRGGSWVDKAELCRSASRVGRSPDDRINYIGFRVALSASELKRTS